MQKALLLLGSLVLLAGCAGGGDDPSPSSSPASSSVVPETTYVVTLLNGENGNTIATHEVKEGESFARPNDPVMSGYVFGGWYTSAAYVELVSFPMRVTSDVSIYAKFDDPRNIFLDARDKTFIETSSFAYTSSTVLGVGTASSTTFLFNGTQSGSTSYNGSSSVSYLETHTNAGALFNDGFKTAYEKNGTLYSIEEDENHEVIGYKTEAVSSDFRYESSSFAKALFEYKESDIKSVTQVGSRYEIKTTASFSSVASLILNQVNNALVEKIVGQLPETDSSYHIYVTFDSDGYISSYDYEFDISVSSVRVALSYGLDVTSAGKPVSISEPSFPGLYLSESEVSGVLATINSGISAYKALEYSAYDFRIDSTLDVVDQKSVGVTSQGTAIRKVENGTVYYHNKLEVDSELKDSDMYGSDENVEDYVRTRAKLSDGSVYDMEDPLIGFKKYTEVASPLASDEFYGLISSSLLTGSYVDAVQKTGETAYDEYSLVVGSSFVTSLMSFVNDITRIDPTLTAHYLALGNYTASSLELSKADVKIGLTSGVLSSVSIVIAGLVDTAYEGTSISGRADLDLSIELTMNDKGEGYVVPADTGDIE